MLFCCAFILWSSFINHFYLGFSNLVFFLLFVTVVLKSLFFWIFKKKISSCILAKLKDHFHRHYSLKKYERSLQFIYVIYFYQFIYICTFLLILIPFDFCFLVFWQPLRPSRQFVSGVRPKGGVSSIYFTFFIYGYSIFYNGVSLRCSFVGLYFCVFLT